MEMCNRGEMRGRVAAGWVTLLCAITGCLATSTAFAFRNVQEGNPAPEFSLPTVSGGELSLSGARGKALVLAFVRQGQEKSATVLRDLAVLEPSLAERVTVYAVVTNPDEGDAGAWATEAGATYPVLLDTAGDVYALYGVFVTPSTGVIGPEGKFRGELGGHSAAYKSELEHLVKAALGIASAAAEADATQERSGPAETEERKTAERHIEKARLLLKRKMRDKALAAAKEAVAADGSYVEAQVLAGSLLLDVSDANADEAMGYFEAAQAIDPKNVEVKIGIARVKSAKGEYEEAIALLTESARLNPRPEKLYYQLGLVYERAGQFEKAVQAYRNALERLME